MLAAAYNGMSGKHSPVIVTVLSPAIYSMEEVGRGMEGGGKVRSSNSRSGIIFSCSLQLFGEMKSVSDLPQWSTGILTQLLQELKVSSEYRQAHNSVPHSAVKHWVVLEGPMSAPVMKKLTELLSPSGLHLPSGEVMHLPGKSEGMKTTLLYSDIPLCLDTCKIIIETNNVGSFLDPSSLSSCAVLHCTTLLSLEDLLEAWLRRAPTEHNLSTTA